MKMQIMTKKLQEALEQFLFLMLEMTASRETTGCLCCMLYIIKNELKGGHKEKPVQETKRIREIQHLSRVENTLCTCKLETIGK